MKNAVDSKKYAPLAQKLDGLITANRAAVESVNKLLHSVYAGKLIEQQHKNELGKAVMRMSVTMVSLKEFYNGEANDSATQAHS